MKLTIVIPAFNEEEAIGDTIRRCQAAVPGIISHSPVTEVAITVVSDGSTDRTAEIARRFDGVRLIEFPRNRGYGAAIKAGFAEAGGDLVAFLDADGTCDPEHFTPMCRAIAEEKADVVIGSRIGPDSKMPWVRALGNRLYALLLGVLSNKPVSDTASGMRVIRVSSLKHLYPLPDGLHFTPAMSARVLMDDQLRLVEVPMSYEERVGRSKLRVLRDGLRFAGTITDAALVARPSRVVLPVLAALIGVALIMLIHPAQQYFRRGALQDWMIYRAVAALLITTVGMLLLATAAIADRIVDIALARPPKKSRLQRIVGKTFNGVVVLGLSLCAASGTVVLMGMGVWDYLTTGVVTIHWWRVLASATLLIMGATAIVTWLLLRIMSLLQQRHESLRSVTPPATPTWSLSPSELAVPGG